MFSASLNDKNIILESMLKSSLNCLAHGAKASRKTEYHETHDEIMEPSYALETVIK